MQLLYPNVWHVQNICVSVTGVSIKAFIRRLHFTPSLFQKAVFTREATTTMAASVGATLSSTSRVKVRDVPINRQHFVALQMGHFSRNYHHYLCHFRVLFLPAVYWFFFSSCGPLFCFLKRGSFSAFSSLIVALTKGDHFTNSMCVGEARQCNATLKLTAHTWSDSPLLYKSIKLHTYWNSHAHSHTRYESNHRYALWQTHMHIKL